MFEIEYDLLVIHCRTWVVTVHSASAAAAGWSENAAAVGSGSPARAENIAMHNYASFGLCKTIKHCEIALKIYK